MASTLHDRINQKAAVDAWARFAISHFQKSIRNKRVNVGRLINSFTKEIKLKGGDVEAVMIKFNNYGRFVDMGVGRGVPIGARKDLGDPRFLASRNDGGQLHKYNRVPKKWYSRTKSYETHRLREILIKQIGSDALAEIETNFANNVTVRM